MSFVTLEDIITLQFAYEDYCDECKENGIEPLNEKKWYKEIWENLE